MIFAFALLAAITRIGDLAEAVRVNIPPPRPEFCVTGTVSYVIVFQNNLCHVLTEDGGVGVDVLGSFRSCPKPVPGDRIRLNGALVYKGARHIKPEFSNLEILGHAASPKPIEGPAREIMGGAHDFRRAWLVGELRDVKPSGSDPCWNYISIISDGSQYYAPIPTRSATLAQLEDMVGSTVQLDGFPDSSNSSFKFIDESRFMVAGLENIKILNPPPKDPFERAPSIDTLHRMAPETLPRLGRHKAVGTILSTWQSRHALLRTHDMRKAIVTLSAPSGVRRGDTVEVIGYPSTDGFTLNLSHAIARAIPGEPFSDPPVPKLSEDDMANHLAEEFTRKCAFQGRRLQLCGTIADLYKSHLEGKTFPLSVAGHILDVDFSSIPGIEDKIVSGCRVRVTGTCVLATENWAALSSGTQLSGILLVADRPDDIAVLAYPPWWTPARLTAVVAILALTLCAILVWNRQLRTLSEKRGQELFQERTASALAELKTSERTRLAAEIHDSISQILTGAAMQLDAGETGAAKRILASCRRELRCCLWDLRGHALDAQDFADAVRETLAPHLGGVNAVVDFEIPSAKLSEALRHAALSIIREATVNAVRHGRAGTIAISGELDGHRLSFTVVDDGRGFDPEKARGTDEGHFGLIGMRERVKAFNGTITITSSPGNGTEISVVLEDAKDGTDESERQEH